MWRRMAASAAEAESPASAASRAIAALLNSRSLKNSTASSIVSRWQ